MVHQVMIRDLAWSAQASTLVERVSNLTHQAAEFIEEVRVARSGQCARLLYILKMKLEQKLPPKLHGSWEEELLSLSSLLLQS